MPEDCVVTACRRRRRRAGRSDGQTALGLRFTGEDPRHPAGVACTPAAGARARLRVSRYGCVSVFRRGFRLGARSPGASRSRPRVVCVRARGQRPAPDAARGETRAVRT